jgi:pantoate--beta-alanine ligase
MRVFASINETRAYSRQVRSFGKRLGFVPTMGALHEGHLSLLRAARRNCDSVAASIFVNPTQFGPNEDFARYPRDLEGDLGRLEGEGVDLVFAPSVKEIYPEPTITWVTVEGISDRLCGKSRPGHFRGVTTVVSKLFQIIEPEVAFFGQKDAAQVAVVRRMVRDLNVPVQIEVCPIVREPDGLAMSSRNSYLSPAERKSAAFLYRSLLRAKALFDSGERRSAPLTAAAKDVLADESGVRLEYFEIVDPDSLEAVTQISRPALVAVAAFAGKTRLIDNLLLGTEP